MSTGRRFNPVLAVVSGYLIGAGALYTGLLIATKSASTAATFSLIPAAFFVPVVIVFVIASARGMVVAVTGKQERAGDVVIAVCYVLSLVPFWFSAVALLNGRVTLGIVLFLVYILMAVVPLKRLLRLSIARFSSTVLGSHDSQ
jgi:hypothetical protein